MKKHYLALFVSTCSLIMAGCGSKTGEGITLDDCPVVAERVPLKNGTDYQRDVMLRMSLRSALKSIRLSGLGE
ncbi:MAG: hypothetical protein J6T82_05130 [Bacteroidaceae bacterium]|nr:hypothetical protein [Bacteroidaceae bacterium]